MKPETFLPFDFFLCRIAFIDSQSLAPMQIIPKSTMTLVMFILLIQCDSFVADDTKNTRNSTILGMNAKDAATKKQREDRILQVYRCDGRSPRHAALSGSAWEFSSIVLSTEIVVIGSGCCD